jgi:hypothetical protein
METPSVREYAPETIRDWEPRRVIYNLVLAAVVVAYSAAGYPAAKQTLTTDSILVLFLLAVVANIAYCAAYLVDIVAQISGFHEPWRSGTLDFVCGRPYFCSDPNAVCLYRNVPSPIRGQKMLQPSFDAGHSRGFHSISCSHLADGFGEIISHCTFGEA